MHVRSALATFEPQNYVVVEQFGAEKYLAGQRVSCIYKKSDWSQVVKAFVF